MMKFLFKYKKESLSLYHKIKNTRKNINNNIPFKNKIITFLTATIILSSVSSVSFLLFNFITHFYPQETVEIITGSILFFISFFSSIILINPLEKKTQNRYLKNKSSLFSNHFKRMNIDSPFFIKDNKVDEYVNEFSLNLKKEEALFLEEAPENFILFESLSISFFESYLKNEENKSEIIKNKDYLIEILKIKKDITQSDEYKSVFDFFILHIYSINDLKIEQNSNNSFKHKNIIINNI
jgi:hypothetical protein